MEVADQLGLLVKEWQHIGDILEDMGARIAGFDPAIWNGTELLMDILCIIHGAKARRILSGGIHLIQASTAADLLLKHEVGRSWSNHQGAHWRRRWRRNFACRRQPCSKE